MAATTVRSRPSSSRPDRETLSAALKEFILLFIASIYFYMVYYLGFLISTARINRDQL